MCKHLFPRSIRLLIQRMILIQLLLPISLMKRIRLEIGIRIRYFGLLRVRNPLFREKLDMLVRPRLQGIIPLQPVQIERGRASLGSAS